MKQYHDLLRRITSEGIVKGDRTGTGTRSVFGHQMRFNLADGFPLLTTKKVFLKGIIHELLWFLAGDTNIKYLVDNGVHIWDNDAYRYYKELCAERGIEPISMDEFLAASSAATPSPIDGYAYGDLNHVYGYQWRSWPKPDGSSIDQIRLSCQLYQRSADTFLGVPFNIASYALLTMMIAQECGLEAGEFVHTLGDTHLYLNHMEQVVEQLSREPRALPRMRLNPDVKSVFDFRYEDFTLEDYNPYPAIKAPMSF